MTTLTLPTAISNIRLDLFDTDSTDYRWSDDQIKRQISRGLDVYAKVAPQFLTEQIPTIAATRDYSVPTGSWWIRSVEYPLLEWPRHYRAFRERTNAGTGPSGDGSRSVEIDMLDVELPADNTGTIEITYATAHTIDNAGTTVPQRHWDALYLAAESALIESYLVTTNDNFDFVDGEFRDRVDDTKAPAAWRAQLYELRTRLDQRLKEIKLEVEGSIIVVNRWGDKPRLWDRL